MFSRLLRQNNNKIVIAVYRDKELTGNLLYVYDEVLRQFPRSEIHLIYSKNKMNLHLFKEVIILSNARYLILDDYYLPIYLIKPNKRMKVIQLWHAAGAFKKFGYSTIGTKFGPSKQYLKQVPIHSNYTHVYVSSDHIVKFYAEAFNMSVNNIFPLGIPRIDMFNNKQKCSLIKKQLKTKHSDLRIKDMVNILIAPTYRAKGLYVESTMKIMDALIEISNKIEKDKLIIFKPHPYMNEEEIKQLELCSNVLIASENSINDWMLVSDAFITDYSSSIFEFALLKRPVAHFVPDLKQYKKNRGFYEDIEVISDGIILTDTRQLLQWIKSRKKKEKFNTSRMINYNFSNTKNVTQAIVKHFLGN